MHTASLEGARAQEAADHRRLEQAALAASEHEQRRLGEELHDGLCQRLFSIAVGANLLKEDLAAQAHPLMPKAAHLLEQINATIVQAHNLARGLGLSDLHRDGLSAALGQLAKFTTEEFHLECRAECHEAIGIDDQTTATHLYRIAREAVHNAIRHANPSCVVIRLVAEAERILLSVSDDGTGFKQPPGQRRGMGLTLMQHRATTIGGQLTIQNLDHGGALVSVTVPSRHNSKV